MSPAPGTLLCATAALVLAGCAGRDGAPPVQPLPAAHAHNDYEHARPLLDALDHGFMSIEADIHLVDGELLVAHDREDTRPGRTLRALYLKPLCARIRAGDGRVYRDQAGPVLLLIDIKSEAEPTYAALHDQLRAYAALLTVVRDGRVSPGPVQVIVSGNRPIDTMRRQRLRFAGYDGRFADLDSDAPAHLVPLISDNAEQQFTWRGDGAVPAADRAKLRRVVQQAHRAGRKVRLWATPDKVAVWRVLRAAGVDLINTDDLSGLRAFLQSAAAADR